LFVVSDVKDVKCKARCILRREITKETWDGAK